ncbi:MAG: hypothetical protein TREMPRED_005354 [Tremellales sp. Tagirdzhanova-0007]|nr:MAG: hypothetical protein TREMPRED_005354 [Tremellales sp. Tagirdzhanova-0007]
MPTETTTTDAERRSRSSADGREQAAGSYSQSKTEQARATAKQAKKAADEAGDFLFGLLDGVVEVFGGWDKLDKEIRKYNPAFYEFAESSLLKKLSGPNKTSKLFFVCIGAGTLQTFIPFLEWPLDSFARLLGFLFLYNSGIDELSSGYKTSDTKAEKVKSLLVTYLITSMVQLVHVFLLDVRHYLGGLSNFLLPVMLLVTPNGKGRTVAEIICDTLFSQMSTSDKGQHFAVLGGAVIACLLYTSILGVLGSYLTIWAFLAISTINSLGRDFVSSRAATEFASQMTIWHNLLAIWLWRYLISAIEGITVPGVVSMVGLITHYFPSYFLWVTVFLFAMLVTKKTANKNTQADTWYAKWLLGGILKSKKAVQNTPKSSGDGAGNRQQRRQPNQT